MTREQKIVRSLQKLEYTIVHEQESHAYKEVNDKVAKEHVVLGQIAQLGVALVALGAIVELGELVAAQEQKGHIRDHRHYPDEDDYFESARLGHDRLDRERLADDVVAVERDEEYGQNGRIAHAVLDERDQIARDLTEVPPLASEQVVQAGGHTREQNQEIGDGEISEQIVGKRAHLFFFH